MVGVVFIGITVVICHSLVSSSEDFKIVNNHDVVVPYCSYRLDFNTSEEQDTIHTDLSMNTHDGRFQGRIILNNVSYIITFTCLNGEGVVWRKTFNPIDYNLNMSPNPAINSDGYIIATILLSMVVIPLMFYIGIKCVCARNQKFRQMVGMCRTDAQHKKEKNGLSSISIRSLGNVDTNYNLVADEEQVLTDNDRNVSHQNNLIYIEFILSSSDKDSEEPVKRNGCQPLDSIESHDHC